MTSRKFWYFKTISYTVLQFALFFRSSESLFFLNTFLIDILNFKIVLRIIGLIKIFFFYYLLPISRSFQLRNWGLKTLTAPTSELSFWRCRILRNYDRYVTLRVNCCHKFFSTSFSKSVTSFTDKPP